LRSKSDKAKPIIEKDTQETKGDDHKIYVVFMQGQEFDDGSESFDKSEGGA